MTLNYYLPLGSVHTCNFDKYGCINEYKNTDMGSAVLKPLLPVITKGYWGAGDNNRKSKRLPSLSFA